MQRDPYIWIQTYTHERVVRKETYISVKKPACMDT